MHPPRAMLPREMAAGSGCAGEVSRSRPCAGASSGGGRCSRVSRRGQRLPAVLVPTALALFHVADAAGSGLGSTTMWSTLGNANILGYGPAAREDLLQVRTSLGRISDELHLILGVIDHHLETLPVTLPSDAAADAQASEPMPIPMPRQQPGPDDAPQALTPPPQPAKESVWGSRLWTAGHWLAWAAIWVLDIGLVVSMQLFLESIGRKRKGGEIMPKKSAARAAAEAAAAASSSPGGIPAPSATPPPSSTQRLSVLSQEELLAEQLSQHWMKLAIGGALAVACRMPKHFLSDDSLTCNMIMNLTVMLRCMSLVMLLIREDMTLPKKEKGHSGTPGGSVGSSRRSQ